MVYILVGVWIASGIATVCSPSHSLQFYHQWGYNGLFFYVHMISKNANLFFPGSTGTSNTNVFRLFIAWLNLDLGFEVCFYKTMTQYQNLATVWVLSLLHLDAGILHHCTQLPVHLFHKASRSKCCQSLSNAWFGDFSLNVQHCSQ